MKKKCHWYVFVGLCGLGGYFGAYVMLPQFGAVLMFISSTVVHVVSKIFEKSYLQGIPQTGFSQRPHVV